MDRRHLEQFLAVVEEGSVSAAARRLLLSQPTVSQTIRELEADLGTSLFRRGRGMVLTAPGDALVGPALQVLRGFDGARAAIEEVTGLVAGELTIAVPATLYGDPVNELVATYLSHYPGVRVVIDDAPPGPDAFTLLDQGRVEILVHDATPPHPRHGSIELGTSRMVVVFPPDQVDVPDQVLGLADLAGRRIVAGRAPGPEIRPRFMAEFVEAGLEPPNIVVESSDRRTIIALLLQGVGLAVLTEAEARDAEKMGAVVRALEPDFRRITRLHHRQADLTPAAQALVDLASAG